jgi:hypothetical protein
VRAARGSLETPGIPAKRLVQRPNTPPADDAFERLQLGDQVDFWTAAIAAQCGRSPWTALLPGVVQHGEFHS